MLPSHLSHVIEKKLLGGLDEVQIGAIQTQLEKMQEIDKTPCGLFLKTIEELCQLTPELEKTYPGYLG